MRAKASGKVFVPTICLFVQNLLLGRPVGGGSEKWPCCLFRHSDAADSIDYLHRFSTFQVGKVQKPKPLSSTLHHKLVSIQGTAPIKYWLNLIDLIIEFC